MFLFEDTYPFPYFAWLIQSFAICVVSAAVNLYICASLPQSTSDANMVIFGYVIAVLFGVLAAAPLCWVRPPLAKAGRYVWLIPTAFLMILSYYQARSFGVASLVEVIVMRPTITDSYGRYQTLFLEALRDEFSVLAQRLPTRHANVKA